MADHDRDPRGVATRGSAGGVLDGLTDSQEGDDCVSDANNAFGPVGIERDPLMVAIERDEARRRLGLLSERERRYLSLQLLGFTYDEISRQTGASRRTVERQLLRAKRKVRLHDQA